MSNRTTIEVKVKSWEDVDKLLGMIGRIDIEMQEKELAAKGEIQRIQRELKREIEPLAARRREYESQIYAYMIEHRDEFKGRKSKELTFGRVDFRTKSARVVLKWAETTVVEAIKKLFPKRWREFVKVEEKVVKSKVRQLSPAELAEIGVELVREKDTPGFTIKYEKVKEVMGR